MVWTAFISWVVIGLFGLFYNITYIDEAKYLIKGWLMATGQVGYYSTQEFFYQHMPGGLLWFGLGQKIFGPSLFIGRLQSFILCIIIFSLTYILAKSVAGKTAGKLSLLILSLAPGAELYYTSATPHALAITAMLLAFIALFKNKTLWASLWFSLAFIVRENFIFTLIIYLVFIIWRLKISKYFMKNLLVIFTVLAIFFIPGWPGILKVLYNFPGISFLLPISSAEKMVLGLNWQIQNYDLSLYFRAILEFGVIYLSLGICLAVAAFFIYKNKLPVNYKPAWYFLLLITALNFFAHVWGAFQLTPRAIVSYMAYITPLLAAIGGIGLTKLPQRWLKFYPILLIIALYTNRYSSVAGNINKPTDMQKINQSTSTVTKLTNDKNKIIWLAEPIALYTAGKISYYPLINHTNFYKPSTDTATVRDLGFWNQSMMNDWLNQAEMVVIDPNRLKILNLNQASRSVVETINTKLKTSYFQIYPGGNIWPENLEFYFPQSQL